MPMDQLGEAVLRTYALKTAFLHECEQYPEARFWTKNEISKGFWLHFKPDSFQTILLRHKMLYLTH